MEIELTDNNQNVICTRKDVEPLFKYSGISVDKLCSENDNLMIFPEVPSMSKDHSGNLPIFEIVNTHQSDQVKIVTGNLMGFIGIGNVKLKIKSRFDKGRGDYLLHYMLQRTLSINLLNLDYNKETDDVFDFLLLMFPYCLNAAIQQGLYREYKRFDHNDINVKGTVDTSRHISKNIPFIGKIAYSVKEFSYDNDVTQLIRHTIEFIKTKEIGNAVLNVEKETKENIRLIIDNTTSYNKSKRQQVITKNLKSKSHPYYTEYKPLQQLCLQILRMEELKYGNEEDEICGILFDGAWLWEEYLKTLLCPRGFIHPENKEGRNPIYIFEENGKKSGKRFPDFYSKEIVLDAKYKDLCKFSRVSEVDRNDIHQIITYMTVLDLKKGGFISPNDKNEYRGISSSLINDKGIVSVYGVLISKEQNSFKKFCEEMIENETQFLNRISYNS